MSKEQIFICAMEVSSWLKSARNIIAILGCFIIKHKTVKTELTRYRHAFK